MSMMKVSTSDSTITDTGGSVALSLPTKHRKNGTMTTDTGVSDNSSVNLH